MNIRLIVGIVIMAVLLAGYFNVIRSRYRNAKGPRERQFVSRAGVVLLVYMSVFFVGLFLSSHIHPLMCAPIAISLIFGTSYWKRRQSAIRLEEKADV